jgi:Flp pilus assembly pilin Flp
VNFPRPPRTRLTPQRESGLPSGSVPKHEEENMNGLVRSLWSDEDGQDIAEYAVMLAAILVVVIGTLRLVGSNTNTVFSSVASTLQ